jgi:non-specific serine/threonine protein kinase
MPGPVSVTEAVAPASNLPAIPTSFIGREAEVERVVKTLWRADVRWLTLTGPPGTGKTRLALQAAGKLVGEFSDGVYFVPLAPISDPALVVPATAHSLGVRESADVPLLEGLKTYLRTRNLLLVLDNFEQVVEGATLFSELQIAAPGLKVLATSRVPLHLYGEHEYPVPPLAVPDGPPLSPQSPGAKRRLSRPERSDASVLATVESVQLFVRRAQAVRAGFALDEGNAEAVAQICRLLEGLPLAIELAAARARHWEPRALVARLEEGRLGLLATEIRDLPPRQRTLRGAIAWSYDLLDDEERKLFRRLSVFVGGYSLDAAEAVCVPSVDDGYELRATSYERSTGRQPSEPSHASSQSLLDSLTALADKSLLRGPWDSNAGEVEWRPRFSMLETIREYAREQLEAEGETRVAMERYAAYYVGLAEEAESQLGGGKQGEWLQCLEEEHDNLRAVLRWAIDGAEADTAIRLVGSLWRFWYRHAHITEGRRWLEAALENAEMRMRNAEYVEGDPNNPQSAIRNSQWREVLAKALNGAGAFASIQGDFAAARERFEASLALRRELGDKQSIANSLINLGTVAQEQGDFESALPLLEESLALGRELGEKRGIGIALNNLSTLFKQQGDNARARVLQEEALSLRKELGDQWGVAMSFTNLGAIAEEQRDYASARSYLEQALALWQSLGGSLGIASSLEELGRVAAKSSPESAAVLRNAAVMLGAAEKLRETLNTPLSPTERPFVDEAVAQVQARLGATTFAEAWAEGRAMSPDEAVAYARGA